MEQICAVEDWGRQKKLEAMCVCVCVCLQRCSQSEKINNFLIITVSCGQVLWLGILSLTLCCGNARALAAGARRKLTWSPFWSWFRQVSTSSPFAGQDRRMMCWGRQRSYSMFSSMRLSNRDHGSSQCRAVGSVGIGLTFAGQASAGGDLHTGPGPGPGPEEILKRSRNLEAVRSVIELQSRKEDSDAHCQGRSQMFFVVNISL